MDKRGGFFVYGACRWLFLLCLGLLAVFFMLPGAALANRGVEVVLRQQEVANAPVAGKVQLYSNSHALVIGIDNYSAGWPRLSNAVKDAQKVASALKQHGFDVTEKYNTNGSQLKDALEQFFVRKGQDTDARLFVWFAGHGHTLDGEGFLVPADAPRAADETEFKLTSLSMRRFGELVRLANSKHAMAVFDSCFSGTIFDTSRSTPPPAVTRITTQPVRQYISSGDAGQEVSDSGTFQEIFIRALSGTEQADANRDGYLTGTELGLYLSDRLSNLTQNRQTPRYGKLRDHRWDQGDFVFLLAGSSGVISDSPAPAAPAQALLSVSGNVAGAAVYWNNSHLGQVPLQQVRLNPGEGELRVEKQGYSTFRTRVRLNAGREASLTAYLEPAAPPKARLFVDTIPSGARVRVLNIGPGYSRGMELEGGSYHLEVTADGYNASSQWVQVDSGQDRYVTVRLEKKAAPVAASPTPAAPAPTKGQPFTNSIGMTFVYIPPGTFMMGSPASENGRGSDEGPQHRVTLTKGYWMQTTEVTQGQWKAIMGSNPSHFKNCGDNCPVEQVSWNDAQSFIRSLNQIESLNYRLPKEAEWEHAARADTEGPFNTGDCLLSVEANYNGNFPLEGCQKGSELKATSQVASFPPNSWGLYDLHGNVWEWCEDWYGAYPSTAVEDPKGPEFGTSRVIRGGSWYNGANSCRSACRSRVIPHNNSDLIGFRLVMTDYW